MGLAASQARFLQMTARKSDNEYEAQQINQQRLAISQKLQEISTKYNDGMNNRKLMLTRTTTEGTETVRLNYSLITAEAPLGLGYRLVNKDGIEVCPEAKKEENNGLVSINYDDRCLDSSYMEEQLRNGEWMLQKPTDDLDKYGNRKWEDVHYSSLSSIQDVLDTTDDAAASAEYQEKLDYFQQKDKQLELKIQQLQTSHNAIQTEIDSVKKVIEKNTEKTFKTFG